MMMSLQSWRHGTMFGRRAAVFFPSFPIRAGTSMLELSHMGKNNGNPHLVCEKLISNLSKKIFVKVFIASI